MPKDILLDHKIQTTRSLDLASFLNYVLLSQSDPIYIVPIFSGYLLCHKRQLLRPNKCIIFFDANYSDLEYFEHRLQQLEFIYFSYSLFSLSYKFATKIVRNNFNPLCLQKCENERAKARLMMSKGHGLMRLTHCFSNI